MPPKKKEKATPGPAKPKSPVSIINAKGLVKGSFVVAGNKLKILAFAKDGTRHERNIPLEGKDSVTFTLA